MLCIFFASWTLMGLTAASAEPTTPQGWTLDPSVKISPESAAILRHRFPTIESPSDLSRILVSTSFKSPSSSLRAEMIGNKWIVKGSSASTIIAIDFVLAPLTMLQNLRTTASKWIGQVHTDELKNKVEADTTLFMHKSGYRNASTKIQIVESGNQIEYKATLNIGVPCVIRGYDWPERLPDIKVPILENGDTCDDAAAAASIDETEQKLRQSGWVQASLEFNGFRTDPEQTIAYVKVSGSIGDKITYSFIDPITKIDVSNQLTSSEIQSIDPRVTGPDAVSYELLHQLRERGYSDATINGPEIVRTVPGSANYVFTVTRGEIYRVQSLQFEGNQFFSSGDLASTMRIEAIQSSDGQGTLPAYGPDALSVGIELVKDKYIKAGFWDVKITDRISPMQSSDPNRLRLSIGVEEGQRKLLNHLEIEGNRQIQTDEIIDYWQTKVGEPFDHAEILNYQQKVRTEYASRGFFYTTINAELISGTTSLQDAPITLKFTIDEGPRVKFGDIFVAGLVKTNQKVVTREVLFETGDWYDPDLVLASRNALQRLGVFSSVIITPVDPVALANRAEIMDFLIEVKEAPSRTISFGPGWSSFYGMRYNVEGALLNLAGTGRQLFSRASFDQEKSQNAIGPRTLVGRSLSAGYLEPHVLDSEINGKISVSQGARSTAYAWTLTKAGELELTHTLKVILPGSKVGVFYGRDLNEEESRPDAKDAFLADTFSVGRLGVRFNIDHRDDQTWPTKGFTFNSEASWARYELGGDLRYFKWELGNNHYFSLTENLVFALGANFSAYEDIRRRNQSSNDILPATARLGIGGTESVRGFPGEKRLGPQVLRPNLDPSNNWIDCGYTDSPSGGSRRTLLKSELRYRWTPSIATTSFIDSGNTSFSAEEMAKFQKSFAGVVDVSNPSACPNAPVRRIVDNVGYELEDLPSHPEYIWERHYTSVGAAVNFLTPIGSINLAYGVPWHEPKSDECKTKNQGCRSHIPERDAWWRKGEIHFNVGAKF